MKISIAITTYQRTTLLFEAIENALQHDFIDEIVVSDDASNHQVLSHLNEAFDQYQKVKLFHNESNLDCYRNKAKSVERSTNEWVCILDSDNKFSKEYFDRVENLCIAGVNPKTIYQPEFAKPHFDFSRYSGLNITAQNVASYMGDSTFQTMLNAFNYFVNRSEYLRVFDASVDPVTSDSIFHNYNWLKAGNSIYIVPGLQYEHRVHDGSHYQQNVRRTPRGFHDSVIEKLKALR